MKVRVKTFAWLRDQAGPGGTLELPEGATPRSVLEQLLGAGHPMAFAVAFAVNLEYSPGDRPLKDGDEVALLPPVSGG